MSSLDRNVGPQQPVGSLLLEATTVIQHRTGTPRYFTVSD